MSVCLRLQNVSANVLNMPKPSHLQQILMRTVSPQSFGLSNWVKEYAMHYILYYIILSGEKQPSQFIPSLVCEGQDCGWSQMVGMVRDGSERE